MDQSTSNHLARANTWKASHGKVMVKMFACMMLSLSLYIFWLILVSGWYFMLFKISYYKDTFIVFHSVSHTCIKFQSQVHISVTDSTYKKDIHTNEQQTPLHEWLRFCCSQVIDR